VPKSRPLSILSIWQASSANFSPKITGSLKAGLNRYHFAKRWPALTAFASGPSRAAPMFPAGRTREQVRHRDAQVRSAPGLAAQGVVSTVIP
jgi:outer membrane protein TolC